MISEILAKMSSAIDAVSKQLEENHKQVETTVNSLKSLSISVPEDLLRRSEQIPDILSLVSELALSSTKIQNSILDGVQNLQARFQSESF
jgi:methyl-accepting chemotaxis protein